MRRAACAPLAAHRAAEQLARRAAAEPAPGHFVLARVATLVVSTFLAALARPVHRRIAAIVSVGSWAAAAFWILYVVLRFRPFERARVMRGDTVLQQAQHLLALFADCAIMWAPTALLLFGVVGAWSAIRHGPPTRPALAAGQFIVCGVCGLSHRRRADGCPRCRQRSKTSQTPVRRLPAVALALGLTAMGAALWVSRVGIRDLSSPLDHTPQPSPVIPPRPKTPPAQEPPLASAPPRAPSKSPARVYPRVDPKKVYLLSGDTDGRGQRTTHLIFDWNSATQAYGGLLPRVRSMTILVDGSVAFLDDVDRVMRGVSEGGRIQELLPLLPAPDCRGVKGPERLDRIVALRSVPGVVGRCVHGQWRQGDTDLDFAPLRYDIDLLATGPDETFLVMDSRNLAISKGRGEAVFVGGIPHEHGPGTVVLAARGVADGFLVTLTKVNERLPASLWHVNLRGSASEVASRYPAAPDGLRIMGRPTMDEDGDLYGVLLGHPFIEVVARFPREGELEVGLDRYGWQGRARTFDGHFGELFTGP